MKRRVSYFDLVGRATEGLADRAVGAAITRLSATYRAGRSDLDYATPEGRAAYLWHILPAHVCDLARLLEDTGALEGRAEVRLLEVGAGPGAGALAALEVASAAKARGQLAELRRLTVVRVDRSSEWDRSFQALLGPLHELLAARDAGLGVDWQLEAPRAGLRCDLLRPPPPDEVLAAAGQADLLLVANVLTELEPRGTDALPAGGAQSLRALLGALSPGAEALFVDRSGAPGAAARIGEVAVMAQELGAALDGPRERSSRCGCALTRRGKSIYQHVKLPTTRDADRPVKNCQTIYLRVSRPLEAR